ncbi:hypothetical protein NLG97_g7751 [Lecanicillium saksenae]|uniref:Uncharacterized protein n=1 Tax=Lecanicillium saksenae TaxID=468837 RepID=A0ACC1QKX6_9HYPO|nr:hypothetical protein NLG97_g7751 [Lecanicillium saksenae]
MVRRPSTPLPVSRHHNYTVAWICALHIELAAAQAMLDEIHQSLSASLSDDNTYVLGNIGKHNIVIAGLPSEQYGTNNAAIVVTSLRRTFPMIRVGLMVGIGGGVPSMADIRLGDVVVGSRVIQHDLGRTIADGQLQRTAVARFPHQSLGTAVSVLRSIHELQKPNRVSSILREKLSEHSEYNRPDADDLLFHAAYDHVSSETDCDTCDPSMQVPRRRRPSDNIVVHYGAIASGNQVMRNGIARDIVAQQLNVICFEMEAAGFMDILPCLPIRGICDYSDSHKNKKWQRYAAATAAAYARELLEILPVANSDASIVISGGFVSPHDHRRRVLESLRFPGAGYRKLDIHMAQAETCKWFLDHHDYQAWLDPRCVPEHHNFLWIRGKPGAGKSTLMKFLYLRTKAMDSDDRALTISFFFNARGEYLAKSITGMYRSLLLQLLEGFADLQAVLDDPELTPRDQSGCPGLNVLKSLFRAAVSGLERRCLTCFIDALDECDEQEVMDMVQYFEELAEYLTPRSISLRICLSSRHYPYIDIRCGIRVTLENEPGHTRDLAKYIGGRLRITNPALREDLQTALLVKAAGVFLWVVLVVDILNKEHQRGRPGLRKRLAELPSTLSDLFRDILTRDNESRPELLLCILWILLGKQPLQPREFCHAVLSGPSSDDLADLETLETPWPDTDTADKYVVSCSKGLAEITKQEFSTVQFIHESVRDFLIKDGGLYVLWPDLGFDWESPGHEKLKQCCMSYLKHYQANSSNQLDRAVEHSVRYAFLNYASQNILYHANAAAIATPQCGFLSDFVVPNWSNVIKITNSLLATSYDDSVGLFYLLAENGFSELIRARVRDDADVHVFGGLHEYPLFVALVNGHANAIAALLNQPENSGNWSHSTEDLRLSKHADEFTGRTPLSWAAQHGKTRLVSLLLQTQLNVNEVDRAGRSAISRAAGKNHKEVIELLVQNGADVDSHDQDGTTPLLWASELGHGDVVRLLVEKDAAIDACDKNGATPLLQALKGHRAVAMYLIERGAGVNLADTDGRMPLLRAIKKGYQEVVELLLDMGADVDASDKDGVSPLSWASQWGFKRWAKLLLERGADANVCDNEGRTPLSWASEKGYREVVQLLLHNRADVKICDKNGRSPLSWATSGNAVQPSSYSSGKSHQEVVRLLITNGADIDANSSDGRSLFSWASHYGYTAFIEPLIEGHMDINIRDENGRTPLSLASEMGHKELVEVLIKRGALVNSYDNNRRTPISWACNSGVEELVRVLIKEGAEVNACDNDGRAPVSWASEKGSSEVVRTLITHGAAFKIRDNSGRTPLSRASESCRNDIVQTLVGKGADIDTRDNNGRTPLWWASEKDRVGNVETLITHGARLNASDNNGRTALSRAAESGHEDVVLTLIENGADLNSCDNNGRTALSWAAEKGHIEVVDALLESRAHSCLRDNNGLTPLSWARIQGHELVAEVLERGV